MRYQRYGLIGDILECIVQRSMSYSTKDVRVAYDCIKACLVDSTVQKVVLVAHSQGALIASMVLDRLFADLPAETVSKLEVYTFGCAASHFNNPLLKLNVPLRHGSTSANTHTIAHIEHYVNELDPVPQWGVLFNTAEVLDNRYSGSIFVRMGAKGHLLNQHYLGPMFPLGGSTSSYFLDQVVQVDDKVAAKRENVARRQTGLMRRTSGDMSGCDIQEFDGNGRGLSVGQILQEQTETKGGNSDDEDNLVGFFDSTQRSRDAKGKTVRELSRLWRYFNGGQPEST